MGFFSKDTGASRAAADEALKIEAKNQFFGGLGDTAVTAETVAAFSRHIDHTVDTARLNSYGK